jgi:lysozyme
MTISKQGIQLVKHFEGLFLKAYLCPANVWTIGYGHTGLKHNDGTVKRGRVITEKQADELLELDLNTKYGPAVERLVKVPLKQHEFDALVSFHFNTGALGRSTLLKKLNQMDKGGAALEFLKWTRGGGRVLPGLVRRRKSEQYLFNTGGLAFEFK